MLLTPELLSISNFNIKISHKNKNISNYLINSIPKWKLLKLTSSVLPDKFNQVRKFSIGQLKALSDFLNTLAAAWFTGGIIAPFFSRASLLDKSLFFIPGFVFSNVFLFFSLTLMRGLKNNGGKLR